MTPVTRRILSKHNEYRESVSVKNCKLCRHSKLCNDLPGVCVLIPYIAVVVLTVAMAYLLVL